MHVIKNEIKDWKKNNEEPIFLDVFVRNKININNKKQQKEDDY